MNFWKRFFIRIYRELRRHSRTKHARVTALAFSLTVAVCATLLIIHYSLFAAVDKSAEFEQILIRLETKTPEAVERLKEQGFVRSATGLRIALALAGTGIEPGAYYISKHMSVWEMAWVFKQGTSLKWIVIQEGLRKEQIANILAENLKWSQASTTEWVMKFTNEKADEKEGVYFPDTYLIPVDESPEKVAERLRAKFNEKFAPFARQASRESVRWTTALKIASLIQREAASKDDMKLISGIIWNRLLDDMRLEIDATVQYARDNRLHYKTATDGTVTYNPKGGWWTQITPADIRVASPYNTYLQAGLPPTPINNPGLDAIEAALDPAETNCLFYIHDSSRRIHCAATYAEQLKNIDKYLR